MRLNLFMADGDRVVRAMTDDGAFRIVAARTTQTSAAAVNAQSATGTDAIDLAELITCAVLYRETMAPNLRVQCIVRRAGGGDRLVADAHPDGWVRGLVQSSDAPLADADDGTGDGAESQTVLQMMRSLPNGDLYRGIVAAPEPWNLSDAFMRYMHRSEQIVSMISIGSSVAGDVRDVAGYVVQVLPEARDIDTALEKMTQRLEDWSDISEFIGKHGADVDSMVEGILADGSFTRLSESEVRFGCNCSQVRVMTTLSTLGRDDLHELIQDGTPIDLTCDYCGTEYLVEPAQLQGLLDPS